jgi:hypothetical protein
MTPKYKPATLTEQKEAADANLTTLRAAVAAFLGGAPLDWIAERHGYSSPQTARVAVERFLGETHTATDLNAARNKARARYERLLQGEWWDATHPFEEKKDPKADDVRNEAHQAALVNARGLVGDIARLDGLNAPTQLQLYVPGSEEMMAMVANLRELKQGKPAAEADIFDGEIVEDDDELPDTA